MYINLANYFDASRLAAKRWQIYLREQNEKRRYSYKNRNNLTAIVWLITLVILILEKVHIKKKRKEKETILVE
jgi:hypothetical protein